MNDIVTKLLLLMIKTLITKKLRMNRKDCAVHCANNDYMKDAFIDSFIKVSVTIEQFSLYKFA